MGPVHTTHSSFQQQVQVQVESATKERQQKVQRRMAAMAVTNYKRRTTHMMQKSEEESTKFNSNQQSSSSSGIPDQGCFTSSRPTTTSTGEGGNPKGTKKWSCDADGVTINNKWFPSTTRTSRRLSFSGQEFLSAWGQD